MTSQQRPAPDPTDPAGPVVFRPGAVRLLAVGWWVLATLLVVDLLWRGEGSAALVGVPLLAFSCAGVHALFWYPAVAVDDAGVELVNVLRRVRLPWASLSGLDTRWALTIEAGERRWTSWAAPASGRRVRPVSRREAPWADPGAEAITGSRAPGSSAGEAAVLVGIRWQVWQDRAARGLVAPARTGDGTPADGTPADGTPADATPADGRPADGRPEVRWNLPVVALLGGTTSAAVVAVVHAWSV